MPKSKSLIAILAGALALAVTACSPAPKQESAEAPAAPASSSSAPGILQPQMTVEGSSYSQPMGKLGEAPAQAWSATTMGAAVDGKPESGEIKTVTGEIVDFSCYLQIGKHGEKHRGCGQKCLQNGQPIGLLAEDGTLYMLMPEEHDPRRDGETNFRDAATEHVAHIMEVSGTETDFGGYKALYVQGFLKK